MMEGAGTGTGTATGSRGSQSVSGEEDGAEDLGEGEHCVSVLLGRVELSELKDPGPSSWSLYARIQA